MGPIEAAWGLIVQITITVSAVAGGGKTESIKLHDIVVVIGITISSSPHIILNQSGMGTSTSRGWEMPAFAELDSALETKITPYRGDSL